MKSKLLLIFPFVVIAAFLFYWFDMRISSIRIDCIKKATAEKKLPATANNLYRLCLVNNGLPPESVFVNLP